MRERESLSTGLAYSFYSIYRTLINYFIERKKTENKEGMKIISLRTTSLQSDHLIGIQYTGVHLISFSVIYTYTRYTAVILR